MSPLTIYLYDEGLVRFASKSYSTASSSLSDVYTHLTNYSINKNSSTYLHNDDSEMRQGHKWTLSSLWTYLSEQGIDSKPVLESIKDLVTSYEKNSGSLSPIAPVRLLSCLYPQWPVVSLFVPFCGPRFEAGNA